MKKNSTYLFVRILTILMTIFISVAILNEMTESLEHDYLDSERTWLFVFGFGCIGLIYLMSFFILKFIDYIEVWI